MTDKTTSQQPSVEEKKKTTPKTKKTTTITKIIKKPVSAIHKRNGNKRRTKSRADLKAKAVIKTISNPSYKRLMWKGGITRMGYGLYSISRLLVFFYVKKLVEKAIIYTEGAKRKTLQEEDISEALKALGKKDFSLEHKKKIYTF
jgi:histone H4